LVNLEAEVGVGPTADWNSAGTRKGMRIVLSGFRFSGKLTWGWPGLRFENGWYAKAYKDRSLNFPLAFGRAATDVATRLENG